MTEEHPRISPLAISGNTGLKRWGGQISEEFLNELKGHKGRQVIVQMRDNCPIIGGLLYAMMVLIRQVLWKIEPTGTTPEHARWAEFADEARGDMDHTWDEFISEAMSMVPFGWAYLEEVFKVRGGLGQAAPEFRSKFRDGLWGWRKFSIRAQETLDRWEFSEDGTILGMWQFDVMGGGRNFIPMDKALLFRVQSHKNNPEGRSLLRSTYRPWFYLTHVQTIEAIGIERDLAGYPVMQVPVRLFSPGANAEDQQLMTHFEQMVQKVKRDQYEGMVVPAETNQDGTASGYKFSLMTSGGRRPIDVNEIVKRYESRVAISLLGEFVLLGMDAVGSFALSSNKTQLFAQALGAMLTSIAETFNRCAIPRLMKLNSVPQEFWPELTYSDIETPDVGELASAIGTMVNAGLLTPDNALETHVREFLNLPVAEPITTRPEDGEAVEPGVPGVPGVPGLESPEDIQVDVGEDTSPEISLNGAQVAALLDITERVATRALPRESGVQLIATAFQLDRDVADRLMGEVGRTFFSQTDGRGPLLQQEKRRDDPDYLGGKK